jgi:hypothetical protein
VSNDSSFITHNVLQLVLNHVPSNAFRIGNLQAVSSLAANLSKIEEEKLKRRERGVRSFEGNLL